MIFFITVLRAIAAILITNAHYMNVYPTNLIANGGLLGDVIFFAVSGFCLVNIRQNFVSWYGKRIIRIYPVVWIITTIYIILRFYSLEDWTLAEYYLYPTYYHFVASIIVLYVAFYIVMKTKVLVRNIPKIILGLLIIELLVYVFIYDKSTYHIDTVREPMIRFLFFQAMLLGAYFRIYKEKFINNNRIIYWVASLVLFVIYFASKLAFVKFDTLSPYQILNQIVLFGLLYFVFRCFAGIDAMLEALPVKIKAIISFISMITLEIYVVQYVIIPRLAFLIFPLNWFLITSTIIVTAYLLHIISNSVIKGIEGGISKIPFGKGSSI
ncbi:acyltransferase family protein [Priestia megaterium]|uniref:acyltransferase family protein n=1 Tax=Priestia megaterium TaxID=1404 RepID=UPI002D810DDA|nr:acyltransferase family protein [Priestia megaterium]MEB4860644.1 acyltransferase family protein [Priestia megaterium]